MEQTLGQKRVRVSFNPSKSSEVDNLKQMAADFIDMCKEMQNPNGSPERNRCLALAMTHVEDAAMWAVKGATSNE